MELNILKAISHGGLKRQLALVLPLLPLLLLRLPRLHPLPPRMLLLGLLQETQRLKKAISILTVHGGLTRRPALVLPRLLLPLLLLHPLRPLILIRRLRKRLQKAQRLKVELNILMAMALGGNIHPPVLVLPRLLFPRLLLLQLLPQLLLLPLIPVPVLLPRQRQLLSLRLPLLLLIIPRCLRLARLQRDNPLRVQKLKTVLNTLTPTSTR